VLGQTLSRDRVVCSADTGVLAPEPGEDRTMPSAECPLIIDVEASGFGGTSYPIEIGVALDYGHKYCTLIHPEPGWTH
jgi:hypothetical protein